MKEFSYLKNCLGICKEYDTVDWALEGQTHSTARHKLTRQTTSCGLNFTLPIQDLKQIHRCFVTPVLFAKHRRRVSARAVRERKTARFSVQNRSRARA